MAGKSISIVAVNSAPETVNQLIATARFFQVLGDATRLAIVRCLLDREHTVTELVSALDISRSRVSNHLACLRWCEFVTADKRGRQMVYAISDPVLRSVLDAAIPFVEAHADHLASCERIGPDWV
jgi:ArsR family transcriptional regulator, cadmium/lead-responsive transcriptional repressor